MPSSAAAAGDAPGVDVKALLVDILVKDGDDRIVGADHAAHGAADAGEGGIGALIDAVVYAQGRCGRVLDPQGHVDEALAVNAELDGLDGAHGGAAPAQGAGVFVPLDLPGQVVDA